MNYSLRHNKHQNHNLRKLKNYMKVEGFRKIFFETFVKNIQKPKNLIAKIGFLNVKIKRSPNVNKTFAQRLDNVIL